MGNNAGMMPGSDQAGAPPWSDYPYSWVADVWVVEADRG